MGAGAEGLEAPLLEASDSIMAGRQDGNLQVRIDKPYPLLMMS